jgi:hypothetical protein
MRHFKGVLKDMSSSAHVLHEAAAACVAQLMPSQCWTETQGDLFKNKLVGDHDTHLQLC